jgi:hypothetical protein
MFAIKYSKQAVKIKSKMTKDIAKRIDADLESIAANPVKQENRYEPDNLNNLKVTIGSREVWTTLTSRRS